jgi:hypothetical protein
MSTTPDPAVRPKGFETIGEAKRRWAVKIRLLQGGNRHERRLAAKLVRCRKGQRCGSPACDLCVGQYRLDLFRQTAPIFCASPNWTCACIVPAGFLFPAGGLSNINLTAIAAMVEKRLERSSLSGRITIVGIDISLNIQNNEPGAWQLHLHGVVQGENTARLQEAIKAAFPPEPTAPAPYRFSAVHNSGEAITYLFKGSFNRRCRYSKDGKARTRNLPIKGPQLKELAVFLDRYAIGSRLILIGLRRDGKHLIPTRPK